jgi:EAL domain-containing protein (putative c-di-GMP-specific phosphodiesterase class I)
MTKPRFDIASYALKPDAKAGDALPESWARRLQGRLGHDLAIALRQGSAFALMLLRHRRRPANLVRRLRAVLTPVDSVIRLDEAHSAVIRLAEEDAFATHRTAQRILGALRSRPAGEAAIAGTAAIGVAFFPLDGTTTERLLHHASVALGRAMRFGIDGFCFHARPLAREVTAGLALAAELERARRRRELSLAVQPILELEQGSVARTATALEWRHPTRGRLDAAEIAEIAAQGDLTQALVAYQLDRLCCQIHAASGDGSGGHFALDLAQVALADHGLDDHFARLLPALPAGALELGFDSVVLTDERDHRSPWQLRQLAELGAELAARHFGRRPIALDRLMELPVTTLELDRKTLAPLGRCPEVAQKVGGLIRLGRHLGKRVRAVGVSTREQVALLKDMGCDEVAGPLFGPSVAVEKVAKLAGGGLIGLTGAAEASALASSIIH